jgi:hypothetical protein
MQEWGGDADLLRRLSDASVSHTPPTKHTKGPGQGLPVGNQANPAKKSQTYIHGSLPSSRPRLESGCTTDLPWETSITSSNTALRTGYTRCRSPMMASHLWTLHSSAVAPRVAPFLSRPPLSSSATLMDQGLWREEEICQQANTLIADPALHWQSETVFIRIPVVIPYDSPIFTCV